jgi:hypothetical protein
MRTTPQIEESKRKIYFTVYYDVSDEMIFFVDKGQADIFALKYTPSNFTGDVGVSRQSLKQTEPFYFTSARAALQKYLSSEKYLEIFGSVES